MSPRIQMALSISAIIYGFTLVAALIYGGDIASHPIETFLGVLLLAGGMLYLWRRWASQPEAKLEVPDRAVVRAAVLGPDASAPTPPATPAETGNPALSANPTTFPTVPTAVTKSSPAVPTAPATLESAPDANAVEPVMSDEEFLAQFRK